MGDSVQLVAHPIGSLEEFLALPDEELYEVVDGQPIVTPSPTGPHQRAAFRLAKALDAACPDGYEALVGPLDWILWEAPALTVRVPDLVVVTHAQADSPRLTSAPLLVIEVLSPYSVERDVVTKRSQYARAGARHYWVVDPRTPQVVLYAGPELREVGRVTGAEESVVSEPFTVRLRPSDLVGA